MNKYVALPIIHPIGVFYLTAVPASVLLHVCYSSPHTRKETREDGSVVDVGHQRRLDSKRLVAISRYLETQDATLPGTIILAANTTTSGISIDADGPDAKLRWFVEDRDDDKTKYLVIPTMNQVAAIVDGQHRLNGFVGISEKVREMLLPCAVFLDLPTAQQASIFATINFNQKPVSKSQTYELFGYNLEDEPESSWSPDKLAVNFTRRFNVDESSPFKGHIKVAAIDDRVLTDVSREQGGSWLVSTATVVEGIISLITNDQKRDRDILNRYEVNERKRQLLKDAHTREMPPFWDLYLSADRDIVIYKAILNFFIVVDELFWSTMEIPVLHKTAGVQALFRVLKLLLPEQIRQKDLSCRAWQLLLQKASFIDFSNPFFTESSGKGRSRIQDAFAVALGLKNANDVRDANFRDCLIQMMEHHA